MYKLMCIAFFAVAVSNISALTEDEKIAIKSALIPLVSDCAKQTGVGLEVIKRANERHALQNLNPCLLACIFRKVGVLTDDGVVDMEKALAMSSKFVSGADSIKFSEIAKNCGSVNSDAVSDGSKGCARAAQLAKCLAQYKGIF